MRLKRTIKWAILCLVVLLFVSVGVLYLLVCGVPDRYRPAQLSPQQRQHVAYKVFVGHVLKFGTGAQGIEPYAWEISELRLNHYLAAMDDIEAMPPGHQPGRVSEKMQQSGLADPCIALRDGYMTLMVKTIKHNKILSADISFRFVNVAAGRRLSIGVDAVRVGHLPIPKAQVRGLLDTLKQELLAKTKASGLQDGQDDTGSLEGSMSKGVARILAAVAAAIDAKPINTELTWPLNNKHVRIDGIEIRDAETSKQRKIILQVTPTRREAR